MTAKRRDRLRRQNEVAHDLGYNSLLFFNGDDVEAVTRQIGPQVVWFHKSSIMDFHSKAIVVVENATRRLDRQIRFLVCVLAGLVCVAWMLGASTS